MKSSILAVVLLISLFCRVLLVRCEPRGFENIENLLAEFSDAVRTFLDVLMEKAIEIGEVLSVTAIVVGFVLYGTHFFAYQGRRLIMSGIILWVFLQLIR